MKDTLAQHWDRWLAPLVIILVLGAVAIPAYQDYAAREKVANTLMPPTKAVEAAVQSACSNGSFATKKTLAEFGIPESALGSASKADLAPVDKTRVQLTVALGELGDMQLEYTCGPDRKISSRVLPSSTVREKYLPASLRR